MAEFGFMTRAELRANGMTVTDIRRDIEGERLERVIRGWYALPGTDREPIRAMRAGARLGCVSALRMRGAWVPPDAASHLVFPSHASGRRAATRGMPEGAHAHWLACEARSGSDFVVAPLELAIAQMLRCQPPGFAVAICDSLLHKRMITRNRLSAIVLDGPARVHPLVTCFEPLSESGIESLVRYGLRIAGIDCRVQVRIGRHRVDILIDDWLVLEIDGRATHRDEAFTSDRVRATHLFRDGRVVLQFSYATVVYDWPFVLESVRTVMDQFAPIR